jgi:hypothetical protein
VKKKDAGAAQSQSASLDMLFWSSTEQSFTDIRRTGPPQNAKGYSIASFEQDALILPSQLFTGSSTKHLHCRALHKATKLVHVSIVHLIQHRVTEIHDHIVPPAPAILTLALAYCLETGVLVEFDILFSANQSDPFGNSRFPDPLGPTNEENATEASILKVWMYAE